MAPEKGFFTKPDIFADRPEFHPLTAAEQVNFTPDLAVRECAVRALSDSGLNKTLSRIHPDVTPHQIKFLIDHLERYTVRPLLNRQPIGILDHDYYPAETGLNTVSVTEGRPCWSENEDAGQVRDFNVYQGAASILLTPCIFRAVPYRLRMKGGGNRYGLLVAYAAIGVVRVTNRTGNYSYLRIIPYNGARNWPEAYLEAILTGKANSRRDTAIAAAFYSSSPIDPLTTG